MNTNTFSLARNGFPQTYVSYLASISPRRLKSQSLPIFQIHSKGNATLRSGNKDFLTLRMPLWVPPTAGCRTYLTAMPVIESWLNCPLKATTGAGKGEFPFPLLPSRSATACPLPGPLLLQSFPDPLINTHNQLPYFVQCGQGQVLRDYQYWVNYINDVTTWKPVNIYWFKYFWNGLRRFFCSANHRGFFPYPSPLGEW